MVEFAVTAGAFVDDRIAGDQHAPAACREVLAAAAAEAADVADGAEALVVPGAAVRVRRVLDDRQPVPLGNGQDGLHVAAHPAEVNGHDRAGARGDGGLDGRRRDVVGVRVDVGKDRDEACVQNGRHAGEEGDGRNDDFRAALQAEGLEANLQRAGAAVQADPVAGAVGRGEGLLELDDGIVVGPVPGPQPLGQGRDVLLGKDGPGRERLRANRDTTGQRQRWHVRTDFREPRRTTWLRGYTRCGHGRAAGAWAVGTWVIWRWKVAVRRGIGWAPTVRLARIKSFF